MCLYGNLKLHNDIDKNHAYKTYFSHYSKVEWSSFNLKCHFHKASWKTFSQVICFCKVNLRKYYVFFRRSIILYSYYNRFDQRVARQQLCKHDPTRNNRWGCVFCVVRTMPSAANGPMNSQCDMWHMFSVWPAPCSNRGAVFSVRGRCREDMREYGNGNRFDLSSRSSKGTAVWPEKELEYIVCVTLHVL
jgi:hypothetical protein